MHQAAEHGAPTPFTLPKPPGYARDDLLHRHQEISGIPATRARLRDNATVTAVPQTEHLPALTVGGMERAFGFVHRGRDLDVHCRVVGGGWTRRLERQHLRKVPVFL